MNIAVFCGSHLGKSASLQQGVALLGMTLAKEGHTMLYGGSGWGYMGVAKKAAKDAGGKVVGILPRFFSQDAIESSYPIDELIMVDTMAERKQLLIEKADAFIALPGGIGTLDEITEVMVSNQLCFSSKPIGLLNTDGFFDHFVGQLQHMNQEELLDDRALNFVKVSDNPSELLEMLRSFEPMDDSYIRNKLR